VVVTVAVKVTESPQFDGFSLEVTVVVVLASEAVSQAAARLLRSGEPRPTARL
jgi:hypothetical protein